MSTLPRPLMVFAALWAALTSLVGPTATILLPAMATAPSSITRRFASTVMTVAFSIKTSATVPPPNQNQMISDELGVREVLVVARRRIEDVRHIGRPEDVHLQIGEHRQHRYIAPDGLLDAVIDFPAAGNIRLRALLLEHAIDRRVRIAAGIGERLRR